MAGDENLRPDADGSLSSPEEIAQAVRRIVTHVRREQPKAKIVLLGIEAPGGAADLVSCLNALLSRIPSYEVGGEVSFVPAPQSGWNHAAIGNVLNLGGRKSAFATTIEPVGSDCIAAVALPPGAEHTSR